MRSLKYSKKVALKIFRPPYLIATLLLSCSTWLVANQLLCDLIYLSDSTFVYQLWPDADTRFEIHCRAFVSEGGVAFLLSLAMITVGFVLYGHYCMKKQGAENRSGILRWSLALIGAGILSFIFYALANEIERRLVVY